MVSTQESLKGKGRDAVDGWEPGRGWTEFVLFSLCFSLIVLFFFSLIVLYPMSTTIQFSDIYIHQYVCIAQIEHCNLRSRVSSTKEWQESRVKTQFLLCSIYFNSQEEIKGQTKKDTCLSQLCCQNKIPQTQSLKQQKFIFYQFQRLESPRSRNQLICSW